MYFFSGASSSIFLIYRFWFMSFEFVGLSVYFTSKKNLVENLKLSFFEIIFIQGCLWTCAFSLYIFDSHCKVLLKLGSQEKFPKEKTTEKLSFQTIGKDYASPIDCRLPPKKDSKVYILLFSDSLSRAAHLELTSSLTIQEFIKSLKNWLLEAESQEQTIQMMQKRLKDKPTG